MILTCPACATSYFVSDDAIGTNGRRVRCKSCGHDWHAAIEDEPLDLGSMATATLLPADKAAPVVEEEPAIPPPLPQAFRAREQEKRRARKAAKQGLSWAIFAVALISSLSFAYLMRDSIVSRVPGLASAYKAVGIQTNAVGLEFEAVNARYAAHDTSRVVVSGALRNIRGYEIVAPAIRISMRDNAGREIGTHILKLDAAPVLPGKVQGFAAVVPNTDGRFASAATTFVVEKQSPTAPSKTAAAPVKSEITTPTNNNIDRHQDGLRRFGSASDSDTPLDSKPQSDVSPEDG